MLRAHGHPAIVDVLTRHQDEILQHEAWTFGVGNRVPVDPAAQMPPEAISLRPIVANMTGLIGKIAPRLISQTAPRAHPPICALVSSADLRPGLIRRTAPGRKWAHPASKYTWYLIQTLVIRCTINETQPLERSVTLI